MSVKPTQKHTQCHLLYPDLINQVNPNNPLCLLAKVIPWDSLEKEFLPLYSKTGRPAKPIRLMIGLLLLKQIENLSDERVVEAWVQNPYYQSFCGIQHFQWAMPCDPSELVHFRKRIEDKGVSKILKVSIELHGKNALEKDVVIDTTVQEKNITFPTDTKLREKVINKLWDIASEENITLRRSYKRELKKLRNTIRFSKSKVNKAIRRVQTIANALLRDVQRKLSENAKEKFKNDLETYGKVINQKREDKNKIYSLHEQKVVCIGKGKAHKKYEFGSKSAVAMTKNSCIIVGVQSFPDNRHDSKTLSDLLSQVTLNQGNAPQMAFCDRGFRGIKKVGETNICIPTASSTDATAYEKRKARNNFRRRSAIEPVIGHLKSDFRLTRNYLKGVMGDTINLILAAAAFNFKKWMKGTVSDIIFYLISVLAFLKSFWTVHHRLTFNMQKCRS